MKVPYMKRNLVPDTWTADGEGALPELGSYPHDNSCVSCHVVKYQKQGEMGYNKSVCYWTTSSNLSRESVSYAAKN